MPGHELDQFPVEVSSGGAKRIGFRQIDESAFCLFVGRGDATFGSLICFMLRCRISYELLSLAASRMTLYVRAYSLDGSKTW